MERVDLDDFRCACERVNFPLPDVLAATALPALELTTAPSGGGRSRTGGLPDLPPEVEWPRWKGRSLGFVAQIDLAEQDPLPGFPVDGTLLFFYEAEQETWGFDPEDAGSAAVIYVPVGAGVEPRACPDDVHEAGRYEPYPLASRPTLTLPTFESVTLEELALSERDLDLYLAVLEELTDDDDIELGERGLLGGHPDQIQGDMATECALVTGGLYVGDGSFAEDPRVPALAATAKDWRLLAQIGSLPDAGMMWGDVGCLYYWIRQHDLEARRFDRCWTILQCG